ncbi:MAG: phosphate signaling complex protein PhoU [Acidobacteriota bacterium]
MRHFATELEELNQALLEMGALVESSIHTSIQAVVERDDRIARRVLEDERQINRMELDLDARVTRLLALNQPVARDLRLLVMCLKINTDLERMGDLSVSIAQRAISLTALQQPPNLGQALMDTPRMASLVEDMMHRALDSFVRRDAELADSVLPADDEVDDIRDGIYQELLKLMKLQPDLVEPAVHLMFVARNLERIADHATNIAEDVIYLVRGVDVRHPAIEERA